MLNGSAPAATVAALLALLICLPGLAQSPVKVGSEFVVNTYTSGDQYDPQVASTASGEFVVTWTSQGRDGSEYGVFARRFASTGAPLGGEFQVNSFTTDNQNGPAVDRDSAGNFVIAWTSYGQDGGVSGVFARRFNAAGVAQAAEFRANSFTAGAQRFPAAAMDADGDFVIAWQSEGQDGVGNAGVFARRFNASGAALGVEFQVTSYTIGGQGLPAVDMKPTGDFVIVWQSQQDAAIFGVFGQRFSSSGAPQGPEFMVNVYQTAAQSYAVVATDVDGNFVVAWHSNSQDGSGYGIFARRYDSSGAPQSGEIAVNVSTPMDQRRPSIAVDTDGDFVVAWESSQQDGSGYGVFARRFKSSGSPQGGDVQANTFTTDSQSKPTVASDAEGDFVVAWQSYAQDGSSGGIFAQRFDVPILIDVDGDGSYLALTDGLLLLRFAFGFTGATLTNGAVGPQCTRCDASTIVPYLKSLV